jgi:peptide deformylase
MEILKFPNPNLFVNCKEVKVFGEELKTLLDAMWETMKSSNGIGLAANQVGLTYRMFVMEGLNGDRFNVINPKEISRSIVPANIREGCLSAPNEFLLRPDRAIWIEIQFQKEDGVVFQRVFKDLQAVCVQHEMEHLEGKSYMQSKTIPKAKRKHLAKKWGV